uniref:RRM domain-containing protein n=1 Tax=Gossypium raimondii TaxID=29730 RepID=A0A0D2VQN2_GOSRA|nr:hypothetical protein B456_011G229900 [Gossypium raimondii]
MAMAMITSLSPATSSFSKFIEIKKCILEGFTSIKHLKHVHAALFRFGLHQDSYLLNLVLKASFNFDQTNYTRFIFHQAKDPNVFLWNTMIQGLVSTDCFLDATQFYASMRTQGFWPNNFTFPFVLKACSRLLDFHLGIRIHALVIKLGFDRDVFIKTSLLYLYSKCGYLDYARKVFDDIPDKNVISWTAMISGYIDVERYREAVDLFRKLIDMGLRPDSFSVVRVLSACAHLGDLNSGEWIDRCITQFGLSRNVFVATALVDMYAKCGNMEQARYAFDGVPVKDIITWSTMIQGYASNGLPKEALDLFFQMQKEKLAPDRYSMVGVLSACARLGALELGDWASKLMDIEEFLSNPVLGTALIDMYAKCGSMTQAWEIFKRMKEKDVVVWNAAISGLAMNGHVKPAFGLFGQMEKSGILPNANTFMGLLCGCTHVGLVNDGRRYFDSMNRVFSLTPTIEHYGCMVDLLARAGLLGDAHQLIKNMPMEANCIVWGALLGGCRLHKDTQLAEYVLKKLIELEPWNSGNYVLLSNIYSASHKWDAAAKIRSIMNERGIQKVPGYSWIEVNGTVHEFLVGDKSHPMSEMIYKKLGGLAKELKAAGYIPTTDYVLFDIEEEEKEHFLGCHRHLFTWAGNGKRGPTQPTEAEYQKLISAKHKHSAGSGEATAMPMEALCPSLAVPTISFGINNSHKSLPYLASLNTKISFPIAVQNHFNLSLSNSCISSSKTEIATLASFVSSSTAKGNYWVVLMAKPPEGFTSKPQIIDYYVNTLGTVLGSEKDAQMCIYDASCDTYFGFCCHIDEQASRELARLPEVLSVKPDPNYNSKQKDYTASNIEFIANIGNLQLFPAGNTKHWLVRMDKPGIGVVTKAQMVDYYTQILTKVLGNEKDAQMCIYHVSWQSQFGFCCELDEESANELAGVPGVLSVELDKNFESENKDYGGNNLQNSTSASETTSIRTKKLFITGLSFYTSEKTLRSHFEGFGELVEVKIIMDKISKRSKGYAFVEYTTEEAASAALKEMNGKIINGWMIVVDVAKTKPQNFSGSRPRPTVQRE